MVHSLTFITANIKKLQNLVNQLGPQLAKNSVPFWSARYNAHMNMDTSLPGIVGYFTAMLGMCTSLCPVELIINRIVSQP